jgi:membrane-bound serine protease (ClpP class)
MRERNPIGGVVTRSVRVALAAGLLLASGVSVASAQTAPQGAVLRLQLDGVVDPLVADYVVNGIRDATANGDNAVLLLIDTPGGLDTSMRQITEAILNARVAVICYVSPQGARAASAGAFVMMSCPVSAMAPATNIGAATPVGLNGAVGSDKAVNDAATYMRALADDNGYNADVAESFVRDGTSIGADQALQDNVVGLIAPTQTALLDQVDGQTVQLGDGSEVQLATAGAPIQERSMGAFIGFLHGLIDPNLAFIFFWLGLALIVLELLVPGHIFSGTIGTILLILAVVSFGLLPVRLIGIGLLAASVVAFILEAKHPGLGIWSILGVVFLVAGGWFLYDRAGGAGVSLAVIVPVAAFMILFSGVVVAKARKLRDLPPPAGPEAIIGESGVVLGAGLTPGGVVRVRAEEWHATSSAGSISGGTRIRVTGIDGFVLTVAPATDAGTEVHVEGGAVP